MCCLAINDWCLHFARSFFPVCENRSFFPGQPRIPLKALGSDVPCGTFVGINESPLADALLLY